MKKKNKLNLPKLIGHRGVKNLCPENTIESINKAFDLGLKYVEIDVKISKDEIPILLHDDKLDRTTNGTGDAVNFNYDSLKKLDAGHFFYKKKTNNYIPRLIDIIALCKKRKGNLNIELKPNKNFEIRNVEKIYEITKDIDEIDIFYSSFDMLSFVGISELSPNLNTSFIIDSFDEYSLNDLISISKKYNANICGLNIDIVNEEIIKKLKVNNLLVTVYSSSNISSSNAELCFNYGVDSIFIDDPRLIINKYL